MQIDMTTGRERRELAAGPEPPVRIIDVSASLPMRLDPNVEDALSHEASPIGRFEAKRSLVLTRLVLWSSQLAYPNRRRALPA